MISFQLAEFGATNPDALKRLGHERISAVRTRRSEKPTEARQATIGSASARPDGDGVPGVGDLCVPVSILSSVCSWLVLFVVGGLWVGDPRGVEPTRDSSRNADGGDRWEGDVGGVVGTPILLAVVVRIFAIAGWLPIVNGSQVGGPALFGVLMWLLFVRFVVPVLGVFYGTSLMADEVDDEAITYLFTRPVPRASVLLGKYLAYLACVVLLLLPAIIIIFFLVVPIGGSIGQAFPQLAADLGMVAVGVAAYGAVFAFVGAWLKRPLIVGLVFAFGWEQTVLLIPGYLKRLTVAYYLQALVPHAMPQDSALSMLLGMFQDLPSVWVSLVCLAGIIVAALWLGGRAVENREYVLEQ